jgi:hypothetical protein
MSQITCKCGNIYDSGFKFCPECAAPNPEFAKKQSADSQSPKPMKKKFTKVGESNLSKSSSEKETATPKPAVTPVTSPMQKTVAPKKSYTIVRQTPVVASKPVQQKQVQKKPIPQPEEMYEEYEDEEEEALEPQTKNNYEDYDYEDEEPPVTDASADDYAENEDYEDEYEDEELEEAPAPTPSPLPFKGKGKVLSAPTIKSTRNVAKKTVAVMPKTKPVTQTKSSLGKNKPDYDPNHDGYYDDRLPAILDEVTKTSHMDVILKISLSAVCIAALITYCIFYVQV